MLTFLYRALHSFRPVFSRHRTWLLFFMVVLGFIGATEMIGVTSFCRFWGLGESAYHAFLNFFRSEAYSLPVLVQHWITFVLNQGNSIQFHDRVVLLGDHTYVPKDGRKMPGVVTLHQNSETQSKPSYFRGHCWGNGIHLRKKAIHLVIAQKILKKLIPILKNFFKQPPQPFSYF